MREKFHESKQLMTSKMSVRPKATNLYINISTFVSPIYTYSLAGNITVYTPVQGTNREK